MKVSANGVTPRAIVSPLHIALVRDDFPQKMIIFSDLFPTNSWTVHLMLGDPFSDGQQSQVESTCNWPQYSAGRSSAILETPAPRRCVKDPRMGKPTWKPLEIL